MTREEIREIVLRELGEIAPDADLRTIDAHARLREALDLDSMDVLNLAIALHETLGIEIPETDYPKMESLDGCIDYLASRIAAGKG